MSGASFRKNVMTQSIASYFNKKPEDKKSAEAVITEASRNTSTSSATGNGVLGGPTIPSDQEKQEGTFCRTTLKRWMDLPIHQAWPAMEKGRIP